MKIPYAWLREWVDVSWDAADLGSRLTMAGFELEGLEPGAAGDAVLELNVTPNRGDAMSILGIAREVAALAAAPLRGPKLEPVAPSIDDRFQVDLDAGAACTKFAARVIRGVDNRATTPAWMQSRLQQCGVRSINPIVDVTNYVLLELGQPMHAYDLAKLNGALRVRTARASEPITLLDGRATELTKDTLVIADDSGPVGLAGIMGGERTSVSPETTDVLLEVAYFAPEAIAGRARRFGLQTDASQRFERGVDPAGQERAIERATALILQIAGGSAGPVSIATAADVEHLLRRPAVRVRRSQLERLLGIAIDDARVERALRSLQMTVLATASGWQVTPPPHRFDIAIEADLIEEVARVVGYDEIPEADTRAAQRFRGLPESQVQERSVLEALAARGYHEIITLAFVDPALQQRLFPGVEGRALANPIASDLSVMRVSLWPGLIRIALENQRRQQDRIRLFEHGTRFVPAGEIDTLAGLSLGTRLPEQWGAARADVDFFDVKADVESLLLATGAADALKFEPAAIPCLHPGRAARIVREDQSVGHIGELHPELVRELGFTGTPVLFEIDLVAALQVRIPRFGEVSRFPQVRRDLAVIIDDEVSLSALRERVTLIAPDSLQALRVFDVYKGKGIEKGKKSIAVALIFQEFSRTLTDSDADAAVASIVADLRTSLNARIRE